MRNIKMAFIDFIATLYAIFSTVWIAVFYLSILFVQFLVGILFIIFDTIADKFDKLGIYLNNELHYAASAISNPKINKMSREPFFFKFLPHKVVSIIYALLGFLIVFNIIRAIILYLWK